MEAVYCYDGSLQGFLSCIFDIYRYKEIPAAFFCGEDAEPALFSGPRASADDQAANSLLKVLD